MRPLPKSLRIGWLFILVLLYFTSLPASAQSISPRLKNLIVEVWPEYDRTEVLVIYRGELSPETPLPAQVTIPLPGYIETMHAVAFEQDDRLFAIDEEAIALRREEDDLLLTFPVTTPNFQLEYYDPVILTKQGQDRQLDFNFSSPYEIDLTTFQVQEPVQAEEFLLRPTPQSSFTGGDGLTYNRLEIAGLATGETAQLTASYIRTTDAPSVQLLGLIPEHAEDIPAQSNESFQRNNLPGYVLVAAGVLLLSGAVGGYWWFNKSKSPRPRPRRPAHRPAHRKRRSTTGSSRAKRKASSPRTESPAGFCHHCGAALHSESNFCHMCGTERRRT